MIFSMQVLSIATYNSIFIFLMTDSYVIKDGLLSGCDCEMLVARFEKKLGDVEDMGRLSFVRVRTKLWPKLVGVWF